MHLHDDAAVGAVISVGGASVGTSIQIDGSLSGDMGVYGTCLRDIAVGGDLGGSVTFSNADLTHDLTVGGVFSGVIDIAQDAQGYVAVGGDCSGTVYVRQATSDQQSSDGEVLRITEAASSNPVERRVLLRRPLAFDPVLGMVGDGPADPNLVLEVKIDFTDVEFEQGASVMVGHPNYQTEPYDLVFEDLDVTGIWDDWQGESPVGVPLYPQLRNIIVGGDLASGGLAGFPYYSLFAPLVDLEAIRVRDMVGHLRRSRCLHDRIAHIRFHQWKPTNRWRASRVHGRR